MFSLITQTVLDAPALSAISALSLGWLVFSIRYLPNHRIGVVEKRFSWKGSLKSGYMALNGEAGFQPDILRGGWHFLPFPQFRIHSMPLITIPQGKIGYVFARDGLPLEAGQALATNAKAHDVQNVRDFMAQGGQQGPQRMVLREGTYAINLAQFVVLTEERAYYLQQDPGESALFDGMLDMLRSRDGFSPVVIDKAVEQIGLVTVHDGASLPADALVAPRITTAQPAGTEHATALETTQNASEYSNCPGSFQDADRFIAAGGYRGRQADVLMEGTYYINRLFATVELAPKAVVESGHVGVVTAYANSPGVEGFFSDGELVPNGVRGTWKEPLKPGKYALNPYLAEVALVPTANIILKWATNQSGAHGLDANLSEVHLMTQDAFETLLPVSLVIHINPQDAPALIQRYGSVRQLIEQTLDPVINTYFRQLGESRTFMQLLNERGNLQRQALHELRERFGEFRLHLDEVVLGTLFSRESGPDINSILTHIRTRQLADEQMETLRRQEQTAHRERELREAEARARHQARLTESELGIAIQGNYGKAELARAEQQAQQIRILSEAEACKWQLLGERGMQAVQPGKSGLEPVIAGPGAEAGESPRYDAQEWGSPA